jgi:NAD(P)-dependent dehydrogenase (short-subunit alcohol dehydrogenase family)
MSDSYFIQASNNDLASLAGKTAIVTGGCSGIGLATVKLLASLNCNTVVGDLRGPPTDQNSLFSRQDVYYQECDVTKWESLMELFATGQKHFGRGIDFVIANAGINEYGEQFFSPRRNSAGLMMQPDYRALDVNLKGAINTVALALEHFDDRGGSIVLTASLAGYQGSRGMPIYSAAKHGRLYSRVVICEGKTV